MISIVVSIINLQSCNLLLQLLQSIMISTVVTVTDYHVLYFCNFSYIMLSAVPESYAIVNVIVYHVICWFNCNVICCSVTICHVLCCCKCYLVSYHFIVVTVT